MYKKILTFILALAVILCIVPISALAEDDVPQLYIVVEDSQGNLIQPTDSRISVDATSKTLTIKGSDLTILSDFSAAEGGVDSPIGILEEECNIVINCSGKITVLGYDGQTEGDHPGYYTGLITKSFTLNNGDVNFTTTDGYDYALWCKGLFTMNGGTFTVDSSVESLEALKCDAFTMTDGKIDIKNTARADGIEVMTGHGDTGDFALKGGSISINLPDTYSSALIKVGNSYISGGTITALSGQGLTFGYLEMTGGTIESKVIYEDSAAMTVGGADISNCKLDLMADCVKGVALQNLQFVKVGEEALPFKIHDCEVTAIATGENAVGIASYTGMDFSNVDLYASGSQAAIETGNDPEYYPNFDPEHAHNFSGPLVFSDNMMVLASDTFKDNAENVNILAVTCESVSRHGTQVVDSIVLSTDGINPALTVVNNAYKITKGAEQSWTKGSEEDASFTSNASFDKFKSVLVDGKEVAKDNYTVKEGSTIIDLKAAFLETLSAGKHMLEIASTNGLARTEFTIIDPTVPAPEPAPAENPETIANTGEQSMLALAAISTLSATAFYTSLALRKGKEHE